MVTRMSPSLAELIDDGGKLAVGPSNALRPHDEGEAIRVSVRRGVEAVADR